MSLFWGGVILVTIAIDILKRKRTFWSQFIGVLSIMAKKITKYYTNTKTSQQINLSNMRNKPLDTEHFHLLKWKFSTLNTDYGSSLLEPRTYVRTYGQIWLLWKMSHSDSTDITLLQVSFMVDSPSRHGTWHPGTSARVQRE